jgi:thioredoxin 2
VTASTADRSRGPRVTLRCPACGTLNRIDAHRASRNPTCGACGEALRLDRPVQVAERDFAATVLKAEVPVLVDFYADWCGPCRMVAPALEAVASRTTGRLLVAKVDTDAAPELSARYGIRSLPTLVLMRDGAEAERIVGLDPDALQRIANSV